MADDVDSILAKHAPGDDVDAILARHDAPEAKPIPGLFDRFTDRLATGAGRIVGAAGRAASAAGTAIGENVDAIGRLIQHPADELRAEIANPIPHPERARQVLRGADDLITLGYGQKLAGKLDPAFAAKEAGDTEAAPGFRELGQAGGMLTPGAASLLAKGGARVVKGATSGIKASTLPGAAALGAGRGAAGYELTAPATSALSASAEGDRMGALREAGTDPMGLLMSTAGGGLGGAVSKAAENAPTRVLNRAKADITTGEQNAGRRKVEKLAKAAGPDDVKLRELFGREPELYKTIATKAHGSPAKALGAVADVLDDKADKLDQLYDTMQAKGHAVTPSDIVIEFDKLAAKAKKAGESDALDTIGRERARFLNTYGQDPEISADTMRGLKANAGKGFDKIVGGAVKRDLWSAYSDAIATKAKSAGIDADELRALNRDMSVLIPAQDALQERATAAKANRHSIGSLMMHTALPAAGLAHGGVKEALIGAAIPPVISAGARMGRTLDFELSKRFGGMSPDLSSGAGGRAAAATYAARVSDAMQGGKSLADAVKEADEDK